jgi:C-terminal processing protease CtpA/Prc
MRKRMMVRLSWSAALAALALTGALAGRAAAQSSTQSSDRPWLGVSTQEITTDLREGLDYRGSGVLVNSVVSDSPADRAGLEQGDVLVSFNSRTIDTPSELVEVVRAARVGQSVSLVVMREGQRRSLTARLAIRPEGDAELFDVPTPRAPRAPSAPRSPRSPNAPKAPRAHTFEWDGEGFEMPELRGLMNLQGLGRGRLGVQIQDLNAGMAEALGVTGGKGVLVTDVVEDTPAAKVGFKAGDVITEVGGKTVDNVSDLSRELREHEGRVSITLMRRGARRTVEPELGDKPQTMRWESDGDGDRKVIRIGPDRRVIRIPDVRKQVERDVRDGDTNRDDLQQQLRELREELREMRRKMEANEKP